MFGDRGRNEWLAPSSMKWSDFAQPGVGRMEPEQTPVAPHESEAHAALARLADEPDEHLAAAAAIVELMTAGLKDDATGALLRQRAKL